LIDEQQEISLILPEANEENLKSASSILAIVFIFTRWVGEEALKIQEKTDQVRTDLASNIWNLHTHNLFKKTEKDVR